MCSHYSATCPCSKDDCILGIISMGAASRARELIPPLYLAVVKSHPDVLSSSGIPTTKRYRDTGANPATGESPQRWGAWVEGVQRTGLVSLEMGAWRGDRLPPATTKLQSMEKTEPDPSQRYTAIGQQAIAACSSRPKLGHGSSC